MEKGLVLISLAVALPVLLLLLVGMYDFSVGFQQLVDSENITSLMAQYCRKHCGNLVPSARTICLERLRSEVIPSLPKVFSLEYDFILSVYEEDPVESGKPILVDLVGDTSAGALGKTNLSSQDIQIGGPMSTLLLEPLRSNLCVAEGFFRRRSFLGVLFNRVHYSRSIL